MSDMQSPQRLMRDLAETNPETLGASADPFASFRYVDLSAVSVGAIDWNACLEFTLANAPSRARRVLRQGDVLFGTVRPGLQSHGFVDGHDSVTLVGSTGFSVIRAKPGIADPRFLFHCVMSNAVTEQANRHAVGSSYPALNDSDVQRFCVFAPPVEAQRSIARVLDTLDTTIRQTEAIIEKLKQVKQGLLHDLLTRGIDANGQLRAPQSEEPHLYKASPLGWIPTEWETREGRNVCSEIVVGIVVKPTQYYRDHGIPIFRSANVREQGLSLHDLVYMDPKHHRAQQKSCVKPGDVLTVRTGYPGTSCVVDAQVEEANCVDIIISRPGPSISPQYWAQWINSPKGKEQVLRVQGGLAQQHFNVGDLAAMQVSVPPYEEQQRIMGRLDAMNARIKQECASRNGMTDLKSGLMDDLLTGRVRVTPLLTQPTTT